MAKRIQRSFCVVASLSINRQTGGFSLIAFNSAYRIVSINSIHTTAIAFSAIVDITLDICNIGSEMGAIASTMPFFQGAARVFSKNTHKPRQH